MSGLDGESAATRIERKANIYLLKKNGKFQRPDQDLLAEKRFHSHIKAQADGLVQMSERALLGKEKYDIKKALNIGNIKGSIKE